MVFLISATQKKYYFSKNNGQISVMGCFNNSFL